MSDENERKCKCGAAIESIHDVAQGLAEMFDAVHQQADLEELEGLERALYVEARSRAFAAALANCLIGLCEICGRVDGTEHQLRMASKYARGTV